MSSKPLVTLTPVRSSWAVFVWIVSVTWLMTAWTKSLIPRSLSRTEETHSWLSNSVTWNEFYCKMFQLTVSSGPRPSLPTIGVISWHFLRNTPSQQLTKPSGSGAPQPPLFLSAAPSVTIFTFSETSNKDTESVASGWWHFIDSLNIPMSVPSRPEAVLIVNGSQQIAFFLLLKHQYKYDGESSRLQLFP